MSKNNHDDHYKKLEAKIGLEPIVLMEAQVCVGLPPSLHDQAKQNLNVALAMKYLLRLGNKDDAGKEINKAENFLHRARAGSWRPVAEDLPLFAEPSQGSVVTLSVAPDATAKDINEAAATAIATLEANCLHSFTVTTHGKTAEATEAEVGKVVAELQKAPTPNAPVQPRRKYPVVRECATCKHTGERLHCTLVEYSCRRYDKWEPKPNTKPFLHDCSTCKRGKNNGPNVGVTACKLCFMYANWEPKPEEARVVPRGCASCEDGPSPSHCKLFHERRCGDIGSSFPLWKAKA